MSLKLSFRAGFKGGGQTGQLPRGLHKKQLKYYYLRKHKILFETDNLDILRQIDFTKLIKDFAKAVS